MYINKRNFIYLLSTILIANVANADGGGILLLFLSPLWFLPGNFIIILIEYWYFRRIFKNKDKTRLFKDAIKINLISLLIGTILFTAIISAMSAAGYYFYAEKGSKLGGFFFALGTGIAGDHSPFAFFAMIMLPIYYFLIYFITVWIEYKLMLKYNYNVTLKQSFIWNFLSYSFLSILIIFLALLYGLRNSPYLDKIYMFFQGMV